MSVADVTAPSYIKMDVDGTVLSLTRYALQIVCYGYDDVQSLDRLCKFQPSTTAEIVRVDIHHHHHHHTLVYQRIVRRTSDKLLSGEYKMMRSLHTALEIVIIVKVCIV